MTINAADFYLLAHHRSRTIPRKDGVGRPWYAARTQQVRLAVIHTAENLPDFVGVDSGAEDVARYGAQTERASWHDTIDSDSRIRMLPWSYTAFHVRGYNSPSVGVELATQAAKWVQTPDGWRLAILERAAVWCSEVHHEFGIPFRILTKDQADAGLSGFVGHGTLDPTRRTDPGQAFPFEHVMERAEHYAGTPPGPPPYLDRGEWSPWAGLAIEEMIERGILRGQAVDGGMRFRPRAPVTREELAVALWRTMEAIRGGG